MAPVTGRGQRGEPGHPGGRGEPGKDTGEGGRGGEGGEGGAGGAGRPQGPGGAGGVGGRGARGPQGPPGPPSRLRWAPAFGYLLLALVLGFLIYRVQSTCVDYRASFALRQQWELVADLIESQRTGKVSPLVAETLPDNYRAKGKRVKVGDPVTQDISRVVFVESYRKALEEAGPPPDCRGLFP